jgi:hypothetical protein
LWLSTATFARAVYLPARAEPFLIKPSASKPGRAKGRFDARLLMAVVEIAYASTPTLSGPETGLWEFPEQKIPRILFFIHVI